MTKGVTIGGEVGEVGRGVNPEDVVEIICTDPQFLERASEKKPHFIVRFFTGAYSYPRDWWCGIFYCCMQNGVFGAEAKAMSDPWRRDLVTILNFVVKNPELAARLLRAYLGPKTSSPEFAGRFAGGVFTSYAARGGRLGGKALSFPAKAAGSAANFILANVGAAVLAVKYGGRDIAAVFDAMLTGNYRSSLTGEQYKELFRAAAEASDPIPQEEADALVEITEGVLHCLNNPGEYLPVFEERPPSGRHVPVGQVSSARPAGTYGTIPAGYETNALDVIAERNAQQARR